VRGELKEAGYVYCGGISALVFIDPGL